MTDFFGLLRALTDGGVDFILIGGMAAIAHGSARVTEDLDVVYDRTPQNLARLIASLSPHQPYLRGAPPGLPFHWDERTIQYGLNFTLVTSLGDVDLLGEIVGGGGYKALLPHTVQLDVCGISCRCISLDKLIDVKRATGRPKDFEVVAELVALRDERQIGRSSSGLDPEPQ